METTNKVIYDTNIISSYLQGNPKIVNKINEIGIDNIYITPVIYIELIRWLSVYKGLTPVQRREYKKAFNSLKVLHLTRDISALAMDISVKVDSLDAPDVLIGATAVHYKIPVFTENIKHFSLIKKISIVEY